MALPFRPRVMVVSPWLETPTARISSGWRPDCASAPRTACMQACQYTSGSSCARSGAGASSWYSVRPTPAQCPCGEKIPALMDVVPASIPSRYGMSIQSVLGGDLVGRLEVLDHFLQRVEQAVGPG